MKFLLVGDYALFRDGMALPPEFFAGPRLHAAICSDGEVEAGYPLKRSPNSANDGVADAAILWGLR
jgi:hypothetical protein